MKKKAIITGGTKGIGFAIAKNMLDSGYFVILNYASDTASAEQTARKLQLNYIEHYDFEIIQQKIESQADVEYFYNKCIKIIDSCDALVLNAGCTDRTMWKKISWEQWMHVMDVNINAPAALIRRFDENINEKGNIVFISSAMSIWPHATSIPYTVSKAAVNGLTKALMKEYCNREIRVNAVLPGFVNTPWQKRKPVNQKQRICNKIALHRFAEPKEIADIVMNIINSTYLNGALIQVDGGYCYR